MYVIGTQETSMTEKDLVNTLKAGLKGIYEFKHEKTIKGIGLQRISLIAEESGWRD